MFTLAQLGPCEFPRLLLQTSFQLRLPDFLSRLRAFLHSKTDLPCLHGHLTLRTPLLKEVFIVLSPW